MASSSIASTELVLLSRGLCLEILVMFMGMGGLGPDSWYIAIRASFPVLSQCLSLSRSRTVTGGLLRRPDRILKSNM